MTYIATINGKEVRAEAEVSYDGWGYRPEVMLNDWRIRLLYQHFATKDKCLKCSVGFLESLGFTKQESSE